MQRANTGQVQERLTHRPILMYGTFPKVENVCSGAGQDGTASSSMGPIVISIDNGQS